MNEETRVEMLFYTIIPDITKNIACWKVFRLLQIFLPVRVTFRRKWVWSFGGMTLRDENRSTQREPHPRTPQVSYGLNWDLTWASELRSKLKQIINKLHLFYGTKQVYFSCVLHICYMFWHFLRPALSHVNTQIS